MGVFVACVVHGCVPSGLYTQQSCYVWLVHNFYLHMLHTLLLLTVVLVPIPWPIRVAVVGRMHARETDVVGIAYDLIHWNWGSSSRQVVVVEPGVKPPKIDGGGWMLVIPDVAGDPRHDCDRTGVAGIDLNRDFPFGWRRVHGPESCSGPRPLSSRHAGEVWETLRTFDPKIVLSLHTGEEAVYSPWDGTMHPPPPHLMDACQALALMPNWTTARCGPAGQNAGYLAPGSMIDSVAGLLPSVEVALTIELGGDPLALSCQKAFRASIGAETLAPLIQALAEQSSSYSERSQDNETQR